MTNCCDTPLPRSPLACIAVAILFTIVPVGCTGGVAIQPGDIRTYRTPRVPESAVSANQRGPQQPSSASGRISYDVPDGWSDLGGGGLRLATLLIGDADKRQEVTVIPASGTLESNVARWIGQLDTSADEARQQHLAAAAIADATAVDVDGTRATVVLLLAPDAEAGDDSAESILGAMVPLDDSSALFVKFRGRADVARREQENFHRFVSSLRWN